MRILTESPKEIGKLNNLKTLKIEECEGLKEIPKEILSFNRIKWIDLHGDGIKEIPKEVINLPKLEKLDMVHCNNLKKSPKKIGKLIRDSKLKCWWDRELF